MLSVAFCLFPTDTALSQSPGSLPHESGGYNQVVFRPSKPREAEELTTGSWCHVAPLFALPFLSSLVPSLLTTFSCLQQ